MVTTQTGIEKILDKVQTNQERLVRGLNKLSVRPYFQSIPLDSRGSILIGPRGTGKTTFLLNQCKDNHKALYISLDSVYLQNISLYDLVEMAYHQGVREFYLDEVHFLMNWSLSVKSIYDSFPNAKIILSDSSSLALRLGVADLSRRFPKNQMKLLSFREFIFLKTQQSLPTFNPIEQYTKNGKIQLPPELDEWLDKNNVSKMFTEYLSEGMRPFFLEGRYKDRILNVIEKTIYYDVPYFIPSIQQNHLNSLKSILDYLANSAIPTINIQNICTQWEMGKEKVYELLEVLQQTGMIQIIYNTKTPKGNSKGDKIFFQDCSFYAALGGNLGSMREAYFCNILQSAGYKVITSKNEEEYDFLADSIRFEIGGKNKSAKKSDVVVKDFLDGVYKKEWPLWIFGFMW